MSDSYPTLLTLESQSIAISDLWRSQPVIIFWLRHYG